jgi:hypothetical protein
MGGTPSKPISNVSLNWLPISSKAMGDVARDPRNKRRLRAAVASLSLSHLRYDDQKARQCFSEQAFSEWVRAYGGRIVEAARGFRRARLASFESGAGGLGCAATKS